MHWSRSLAVCENVFSVFHARELAKIEETLIGSLGWSFRKYLTPYEFISDFSKTLSDRIFPDGQSWSDLGGPFPYLEAPTAVDPGPKDAPSGVPEGMTPFAWRVTALASQILLSLMATHSGIGLLKQLEASSLTGKSSFFTWWRRNSVSWSPVPLPEAVACASASAIAILGTRTAASACTHEAEKRFVGTGSSAHFSEFGRADQRGTVTVEGLVRFAADRADTWTRGIVHECCKPPAISGIETASLISVPILREATFKVVRFFTAL